MNDRNIRFIIPSDKSESRYVGFDFEEDNSRFVFPCKYLDETTTEREKRYEAKKLLSLIKKVQKEYFLNGDNDELFQFYSMSWLIRDFIDKGYYFETEKISEISNVGKINWKKTIKNNSVFIDGGNVIYKDLVRYKNNIDEGKILSQIYKCCLRFSVERLGFIYNVEDTERSAFLMNASDVNFMLYYLHKELRATFNTYKKLLIEHLLTVLKGQQGRKKSISFSMYDKEFEYVFEFLVNNVFGTDEVGKYYDQSSYVIAGETYPSSKLRPDTIMERGTIRYVIDAKYYNYGYTNDVKDLPDSSSITKQIVYNHYLKKEKGGEFYSVFLLPYASAVEKDFIKYIGYAKNENGDPKNIDKVAVCLIDLKTLVDVYLGTSKRTKDECKNELVSIVTEKCFI